MPISAKNLCQILLKYRLMEKAQAREFLMREDALKRKLKEKDGKNSGEGRQKVPVTSVDCLLSMNLSRADRSSALLDEEAIFQVLAKEWGHPYRRVDPLKLDLNLVTTTIPLRFAMNHLVLPVGMDEGKLTVAICNPGSTDVMNDIARVTQLPVSPVVSCKTDIVKLISEFFGFKRSIAAAEDHFDTSVVDLGNLEQYVKLKSAEELPSTDQHIVNAVNHVLIYAFDQRASDIHIEPKRESTLVRMRIDGVLHTVYRLPKKVHNAIVSRVKNLSRLDMAEKRRPQDGRIKTDREGVEVEIRVSTVPVAFGEKIVMRVMDPEVLFQQLERLGFSPEDMKRYSGFIERPHGIVLVCGPTGSGKTTTLYSTLRHIATPGLNITTVEDPVEMVDEDFNQITVQPTVDITFGTILRNILRQDPDIIMIGEMRDLETAENAVQAALTGHLVLSTLHTNDAPTTLTRLMDLGVPPFLIQSTLVGIVAQRLVRKICPHCRESFSVTRAKLSAMGIPSRGADPVTLHRGRGCDRCRNTGYKGRVGIFEVLPYGESIRRLTTGEADLTRIRAAAMESGMVTMRDNAVHKLLEGVTTYQEVLRVTWEQI